MTDLRIQAEMAAFSIEPEELHGMVCGMAVNGRPEFVLSELVDLVGVEALSVPREAAGQGLGRRSSGFHFHHCGARVQKPRVS